MHPIRCAAIAVLAIAALALATPAAQATTPGDAMIQSINAVRAAHGLRPVRSDRALTRGAMAHSHTMLASGYFAHARRLHAATFRTVGEIIEWHSGGARVGKATQLWLNSPPHRALILDRGLPVRRGRVGHRAGPHVLDRAVRVALSHRDCGRRRNLRRPGRVVVGGRRQAGAAASTRNPFHGGTTA